MPTNQATTVSRAARLMKIADEYRQKLGDDLTRVKGSERREPGLVKGKQRHDL